jgi:hypothetical protein
MAKHNASIVIPYYKKYDELRHSIEYNYEQFQTVNEVILIIDEAMENPEIFSFLNNYNVNFRFFMNCENHSWRNPAVVINKGIKEAVSEKIIIMSPETIILDDGLINLIENCNDDNFSVGQIIFMTNESYESYDNFYNESAFLTPIRCKDIIGPVYWGSICCTKENFKKVDYYTESYSLAGWGKEDNDVRMKLVNGGIMLKKTSNSRFIHLENETQMMSRLKNEKNRESGVINDLYNNFNEIKVVGMDSTNVHSCLGELIKINTSTQIVDYSISNNISSYYPIVLLCQCFNENKNASDYMSNVSRFVDAIIVLDDGSTDNTWELLHSNKLIIKFKLNRIDDSFNDLRNRNLLLNVFENVFLKNKIKVDWFLWLDFDERLTDNKKFLHQIKRQLLSRNFDADIVSLPLFHMWDKFNYNSEYPYSINGLQYKKRLIRNNVAKLPYEIKHSNALHFELVPYAGKLTNILLQIKHLAYVDQISRERKYNAYVDKYDTTNVQKSYKHFLNNNVKLLPYDDLMLHKKEQNKIRQMPTQRPPIQMQRPPIQMQRPPIQMQRFMYT